MSKNTQLLSEQAIKKGQCPEHIAVIMDGNGRWAENQGKPRLAGHQKGVESVRSIVEAAGDLGIKILTLYAFSEENWGRPEDEVSGIFNLLDTFIVSEKEELHRNNVQLKTIGHFKNLPASSQKLILETQEYLSQNTGLLLNIALSYGSRSEMTVACRSLAKLVAEKKISAEDITPELIGQNLWTAGLADPDLLIRTSGEQRISNFLLWQMAYTELWFTPVYWPDFRREHFVEAIASYQKRERRYGLISSRPESGNE